MPSPYCPPKKEKEEANVRSESSVGEKIRLDPYCVIDRYFRDKDDKGKGTTTSTEAQTAQ